MIDFIGQFGFLFLIIVGVSFVIKLLKQPIIMGYVLSGLLFSLFFIKDDAMGDQIISISQLGITFLLFLMGLEFDLKNIKYLGKDTLITTGIQSAVFFGIGFGVSRFFNFPLMECVYLGLLFMFSSTLLVAKWIEDKKDSGTLYGKVTLSTLIIQDLFAIMAITILGVIQEKSIVKIVMAPISGIFLILIAYVMSKKILNYPLKISSRYPELLFIFSLGVCFFFVKIAPLFGYSDTIGAFIGGITLANTLYKNDISAKLKPLITFFNMLFFVGLGFQTKLGMSFKIFIFIIVFTALSLVLKPIIIYYTLRKRNYDTKTSFITGLHLAQLSEFGTIIIANGIIAAVIGKEIGSIALIGVILTMLLSSYLIKYDKQIYSYLESHVRIFDKKFIKKEIKLEPINIDCNILLFGYYDLSKDLCSKLEDLGKKIIVIENDPENIELMKKDNITYIYNSISNPEFFESINLEKVEVAISSHIDIDENKMIIKLLKKKNPKAIVIVTSKSVRDSLDLYNNDADYVIVPSYLNEQRVSVLLEDYTTDINKLITKKIADLSKLREKEEKIKIVNQEKSLVWDINLFLKKITPKHNKVENDKETKPSDA